MTNTLTPAEEKKAHARACKKKAVVATMQFHMATRDIPANATTYWGNVAAGLLLLDEVTATIGHAAMAFDVLSELFPTGPNDPPLENPGNAPTPVDTQPIARRLWEMVAALEDVVEAVVPGAEAARAGVLPGGQ